MTLGINKPLREILRTPSNTSSQKGSAGISFTTDGNRIGVTRVIADAGSNRLYPVKIYSPIDYSTYWGIVYKNGIGTSTSAIGAYWEIIRVLQIASNQTIPSGEVYPAWLQPWASSSVSANGDSTSGLYYTIQPAIWV